MSGKKHFEALLENYNTPIFPGAIDELNDAYGAYPHVHSQLEQIAKFIAASAQYDGDGFYYLDHRKVVTSDGYEWYDAVEFFIRSERNRVLFALPWVTDSSREDNLSLDRSIAVYTTGEVAAEDLEDLSIKLLGPVKNPNQYYLDEF